MVWTDERMDDLADRMDAGFTRVGGEVGDLRAEMRHGFKDVRAEMQHGFKDVRAEMQQGVKDVRAEMHHGLEDVRAETHRGFKDVRAEMQHGRVELRAEMQHGLEKVHTEVAELRSMMFRFGITMFAGMIGLIATLMAAIVTGTFVS